MSQVWDVIVVGAGPGGLASAIYAGRALAKTLVVDALAPGGQLLISEKIENYPGFPESISGFELAERLKQHAEVFGAEFLLGQKVVSVQKLSDTFELTLEDGQKLSSKTLIWAAGATPRKLKVKGEAEFTGRGVSYCAVCDGAFFKDRDVAVVGGGDSALEEALYLTKFAKKVYLVHRRDKFRAAKFLQKRVRENEKIVPVMNKQVDSIEGSMFVEKLNLKDTKTGETSELKVDGVFIFIGSEPNSKPVQSLVELDDRGFIITDELMRTKTEGLFAVGDVRKKFLRQVLTAAADGAIAAEAAVKLLEEKAK